MTLELHSIIHPVRDLEAAKTLFVALLGTEPHTDQPYYVGFSTTGPELGLDPNGHASGLTGPVPHWKVADIAATLAALVAAGATEEQAPRDVGGGNLVARVVDANGNQVGLIQPAG